MKKIFIVSAKRTPIGKFMGSLSTFSAAEMGTKVIKAILDETKIDPAIIDTVIVGNVLSGGLKQGVGRQCAIGAGIPHEKTAYSINMVCGSGMKAVMNACTDISQGYASVVIAGGTESMSNAGFILQGNLRSGVKMGNMQAVDHMVNDGLTDAFGEYHMGITAENVAERLLITREAQDAFSYQSQQKAIAAVDGDKFKDEIVPIEVVTRKETHIFDKDEFPNRTSTLEQLAKLRPAFKKDGTVTAGNASGINDGASFVMLADEEAVNKYGLKPVAEIVAFGEGGVDPSVMGLGPVPAVRKALQRAGLKLSDMEMIELNEAFAAQSLGVIKTLCEEHGVTPEWMAERTNVHGGAIALGHPIGASGNRILVSLIHEFKMYGKDLGLACAEIGRASCRERV